MKTDIDTRMQRCLEFLSPIARPVEEQADVVHWLGADSADPDQSEDYCRDCCQKEIDRLNAENPDGEYRVSGGGDRRSSDSSGVCHSCGKPLHVSLTDYGVSSELDHFLGKRLSLRGKHAPYEAFYLLALLESAYMGGVDQMLLLLDWQVKQIKENQRDVRKLLRRIDAIRARTQQAPTGAKEE